MENSSSASSSVAVRRRDTTRGGLAQLVLTTPGLILTRLMILGAFLIAWQLASGTLVPTFWSSSPTAVLATLWQWILDGTLWRNLQATLLAMCLGYAIGCCAGVGTGLLLGFMPKVRQVIAPFLSGLYALPKIALAPLLIILLGIGIGAKVALVAITVFFLLLYSTLDGIRNLDRDVIRSMMLMGASRREVGSKVLIPGTLAWIFSGMRIAVRYALTATILGEIIAANRGMGYLIEANAGEYNSTGVFAAVLALVAFCVLVTELLARAETSTAK